MLGLGLRLRLWLGLDHRRYYAAWWLAGGAAQLPSGPAMFGGRGGRQWVLRERAAPRATLEAGRRRALQETTERDPTSEQMETYTSTCRHELTA